MSMMEMENIEPASDPQKLEAVYFAAMRTSIEILRKIEQLQLDKPEARGQLDELFSTHSDAQTEARQALSRMLYDLTLLGPEFFAHSRAWLTGQSSSDVPDNVYSAITGAARRLTGLPDADPTYLFAENLIETMWSHNRLLEIVPAENIPLSDRGVLYLDPEVVESVHAFVDELDEAEQVHAGLLDAADAKTSPPESAAAMEARFLADVEQGRQYFENLIATEHVDAGDARRYGLDRALSALEKRANSAEAVSADFLDRVRRIIFEDEPDTDGALAEAPRSSLLSLADRLPIQLARSGTAGAEEDWFSSPLYIYSNLLTAIFRISETLEKVTNLDLGPRFRARMHRHMTRSNQAFAAEWENSSGEWPAEQAASLPGPSPEEEALEAARRACEEVRCLRLMDLANRDLRALLNGDLGATCDPVSEALLRSAKNSIYAISGTLSASLLEKPSRELVLLGRTFLCGSSEDSPGFIHLLGSFRERIGTPHNVAPAWPWRCLQHYCSLIFYARLVCGAVNTLSEDFGPEFKIGDECVRIINALQAEEWGIALTFS